LTDNHSVRFPIGLVCFAGCFSPSPPTGAPCPDDICPSPLVCSPATKTCEKASTDASADTIPIDSTPDGCYGTGLVVVCPDAPLTGSTVITIATPTMLDTTASPLCLPYHLPNGTGDNRFCVVGAKTISVTPAGRWMFTGARPIVVIGWGATTIEGTIDVASHRDGLAGTASNAPECASGATPTQDDGGPGGSFATAGGAGGGTDQNPPVAAAPATGSITTLRGGCGGRPGSGANAGGAGRGGGALAVLAGTLSITGTINASGAGGQGAGASAGGGGGGSGGMIILDAATISVGATGRIFANGGGGGEGGAGNVGKDGSDSPAPLTAGMGGEGGAAVGGNGGDGATGTVGSKNGLNNADSGGGGGGGLGVIRVFPPQTLGGQVSPAPS
jgi:hypothetical protein